MENLKIKTASKPRGRPRAAPDTQEGQVVHVRLGAAALEWLNAEWHRRGTPSRAETIRSLIDEARARK